MTNREKELEDLLVSAREIASRKGVDTAWERFDNRLKEAGIGNITAKTFKILPDDPVEDNILDRYKKAFKLIDEISGNNCTEEKSGYNSIYTIVHGFSDCHENCPVKKHGIDMVKGIR